MGKYPSQKTDSNFDLDLRSCNANCWFARPLNAIQSSQTNSLR